MKRTYGVVVFLIIAVSALYFLFQEIPPATVQDSGAEKSQGDVTIDDKKNMQETVKSSSMEVVGDSKVALGHRLTEPVGFFEASEDCFERSFDVKMGFRDILKSVGLLGDNKSLLRKNVIFVENGKEVRLSIGQAGQGDFWEATLFDVDSDGLPVFRSRQSADSLDKAEDAIAQVVEGLSEIQQEKFLEVGTSDDELSFRASGTLWTVNDVPVETALQITGDDGLRRSLDCGENRCGCFSKNSSSGE